MNETEGFSLLKLGLVPFLTTLAGGFIGPHFGVSHGLSCFIGWVVGVALLFLPFLFVVWFNRRSKE